MPMTTGTFDLDYTKLNIDSCFMNHYSVPEYQREYVWESKEIEQLFNDLFSAYEESNEKGYFMGILVVYGDNGGTLEIIDGQQRITTFFITMCSIIHMFEDAKENADVLKHNMHSPKYDKNGKIIDSFCLELQYEDSSKCLQSIWNRSIPNDTELAKLSLSSRRIFGAYNTITKILKQEFKTIDELKDFALYLFWKVQFVQIKTNDIADALKIFETINQRGIGLSPMDLLKNLIFMQVDRDDFNKLNTEWKSIIDKIDSNGEKPLRFLRYFITSNYDITDEKAGIVKGILPEDKVYDWLMKNNVQCQYQEKPFAFVKKIKESLDDYINAIRPSVTTKGGDYLKNIPNLAGSSYRLHTLLVLAAKNMDDNTKANFYQLIESLIYYYTVNRVKTNEVEKLFASWCNHLRNIHTQDELNAFVENKVLPDFKNRVNNHKAYFINLNLRDYQKYRMKYILARIIHYIDITRIGGKNYTNVDSLLSSDIQVEHIMPQACTDPGAYGLDEEGFNEYIGKLGNLTLLEKPLNISIQDSSYEDKCKTYSKSAYYLTRCLPQLDTIGKDTSADRVNKKLNSWKDWVKTSIDERQEMLFGLSEEIWNISKIKDSWT